MTPSYLHTYCETTLSKDVMSLSCDVDSSCSSWVMTMSARNVLILMSIIDVALGQSRGL